MSGPPKDVPPNELFLRLLERPRPAKEVPFPGLDLPGARGVVRMQVLSKEQHDRARLMAYQSLKKNAARYGITNLSNTDMNDEAIRGVISDLAACEVIAMSCTGTKPITGSDDDDGKVRYPYVFGDGEAVGRTLSADEVAYLFSAYTMVQHDYGPHEAICLPDDVNAWVERLTGGAAEYPFLRLSSPQWAELLTAFAERLSSLSGILESQWESLPDSLKSALQTFCLGTGSSGEPAASGSPVLPGKGNELSFEEAIRLSQQIKDAEQLSHS